MKKYDNETEQDVKSDSPTHDKLIAQIGNFLVYSLNKSFPDEEFDKRVKSRYYLKIDKLCNQNKLFEHSPLVLWLMKSRIASVCQKRMIPLVYLSERGSNMGTLLEPMELIDFIKDGSIKVTNDILWNLQENFDIISIAYTIKDRIKVEHLPIIIRVVCFEEELIKDNDYVRYVQTRVKYHIYNPLELTIDKEHKLKEWTNTIKLFIGKETKFYVRPPKASTHIKLKNL